MESVGEECGMMNSEGFYTDVSLKICKCLYCSYFTPRKHDMVRHVRRHKGVKPFTCPYCTSRFTERSNLYQHLRTHVNKPYTCHVCSFSTTQEGSLLKHLEEHRQKEHQQQSFLCYLCPQYFESETVRNEHILSHSTKH